MGEGPLPLRPSVDPDGEPRVISLDDEAADRVLDALSADTARSIYVALREDPGTPPELAERLDLSLQNVHYHLDNLEAADLVAEAGTGYSQKGVEMTVYAPADRPLVLTAADEETGSRLRRFLGRILGAVAGLGVLSLVVQWFAPPAGPSPAPYGNATATPGDLPGTVPPGLLFFAGGVVALSAVVGLRYWHRGR